MTNAGATRTLVSGSLIVGALLTAVSLATSPDFSGSRQENLEAIASSGSSGVVSALCYALSQLFLAVGFVGLWVLLRSRVPVLAGLGCGLVVLSCFGHSFHGGTSLLMVAVADGDPAHYGGFADALGRAEAGVLLPFMAFGLLGMVLGMILFGVAAWRAKFGPRWLGPALILWVLVEFVGSSFASWTTYVSGVLYLTIFGALAVTVARSSIAHWQTAAEVAAPEREPALA